VKYLYLIQLFIFLFSTSLLAEKNSGYAYKVLNRNYNTLLLRIQHTSLKNQETEFIQSQFMNTFRKLPNNNLFNKTVSTNDSQNKLSMPDRTISIYIDKSIVTKSKYVGNTGKDKYLIQTYKITYYKIRLLLINNSNNKNIYRYKNTVSKNELKDEIRKLTEKLMPFYKRAYSYKFRPVYHYYNLYMTNSFPIKDYGKHLKYSFGPGISYELKGIGSNRLSLSSYIETSYYSPNDQNVNYALTCNMGISAGYEFNLNYFKIIPHIGLGYLFSYYNVKYSDMNSFYKNLTSRLSLEFVKNIYSKTLFITPFINGVFENGNTLPEMGFLLGVKNQL